jgi:hypothetical protein
VDYEGFIYIVNGTENKMFTNGYLYDWGVPNPILPPTVAGGTTGNPNGSYSLYYTYVVKFPNGKTYETAPSPAATVTVSNAVINWTGIPQCPYTGGGISFARKLYRTSSSLISTYFVTQIDNNNYTSYADNFTDAQLQANDAIDTDAYAPPPVFTDITNYLQRMFGITGPDLYFSEPYEPLAFIPSNYITVSKDGEDLVAVVPWGDQLFIASASKWYRLQGSDSDTWAIRNTFADNGVINPHTVWGTKYGILGLWRDGIYQFDGSLTKNITVNKIGRELFTETISSLSSCYASWDGRRYRFVYPTTGTTLSKCLVLDFTVPGDIRFDYEDFVPSAHEYDFETGINYWAKSNGYQYEDGTTETILASLQTGSRTAKNPFHQKQTEYIYYDIDTGGEDVTLTVYADGVACTPTYTINHSGRTRKRLALGSNQGYRFDIGLSCADAKDLVIYEPWGISFNIFGN